MRGRFRIAALAAAPLALSLRLTAPAARLAALVAALLITLFLQLLLGAPLRLLEERLGAQGWVLMAEHEQEQRITLVSIDEKSLAELGPWPWSRQTMAALSDAISAAGASLQVFDIVFPESRTGDEEFLGALQATDAVIAQVPVLNAFQSLQSGQMSSPLGGILCTASTGRALTPLPATTSFVANNSGLASVPAGHIAPRVAADGGVREIPALVCVNGQAYPALAISSLLTAAGADAGTWQGNIERGASLFGPSRELTLEAYPGLTLPLSRDGHLRIPFHQHPDAFRAVSAVDVLRGDYDAELFDGAWALVGATAFGLGDVVPTPFTGTAPGAELQLRLLAGLLDSRLPYTPRVAPLLLGLLIVGAAALLFALASLRRRSAMYGLPLAAIMLPLLALSLHVALLPSAIWLGWVPPALFAMVAATLLLLLEHHRVRTEHDRVFDNLNSYLPSEVAGEIAYTLLSSQVRARRANFTLLAADLRNFSAYSEARPPEESAAVLHHFFVLATEVVEAHGGRIHEFRGDGLIAVWDGSREGAISALQAAHALLGEAQRELIPSRTPFGLQPLALGIGIEQGPALIGSIGPARRRSYTLLGDTVTIALRVQEMTADLALPILIGEGAARCLHDQGLEPQGRYLLGGLRVPQVLYAPPMDDSDHPASRAGRVALKLVPGGRP